MVTLRVRSMVWFATGVVMTLLATVLVMQTWRVDAAPGDSDSTFVPTSGCRVTDTRATSTVGPRNTPLGADQTFMVAIHGSNGECTGALAIPTDAVGVALNVTAVNATASSNVRIFPANLAEVPLLSNLNVSAGAPPTPNKVDVKLSPDGKIKIYNFNGSVNIVVDIVGYYTSSSLEEIEQRLAALETGKPFAVTARTGSMDITFENATVVSLDVTAPTAGQVTVNSAAYVAAQSGAEVQCSIASTVATPPQQDSDYLQVWDSPSLGQHRSQISGTRLFSVSSGEVLPLKLVCSRIGAAGTMEIVDVVLTAIFTPAP